MLGAQHEGNSIKKNPVIFAMLMETALDGIPPSIRGKPSALSSRFIGCGVLV